MELRCPHCVSTEVKAEPEDELQRCANCGERFERYSALVTVLEAETPFRDEAAQPLFVFEPKLAEIELRRLGGRISAINPYSDADELQQLLDGAQAARVIAARRPGAAVHVHPLSIAEPDPLLAVDPGVEPTLLGFELALREREGEDPIAFTVRFLAEAVQGANSLAAGRIADGERLDRIAAFMNEHRPWNGGDVCEFVARELDESGRRLLDE